MFEWLTQIIKWIYSDIQTDKTTENGKTLWNVVHKHRSMSCASVVAGNDLASPFIILPISYLIMLKPSLKV